MRRARLLAPVLMAGVLGVAAGFAGCKDKESLVAVTLVPPQAEPLLRSAVIDVGGHSETFDLAGGISTAGVSFGVWVPSSIKGQNVPITVTVTSAQAGDCNGLSGTSVVNIDAVGGTYGPVSIALSASTTACPGTGGTTGAGGRGGSGTGGTGPGGSAGGGAGGRAGAPGTGGAGGNGGRAGAPGAGGHAGTPGTGGQAGVAGIGGMGGRAGAPGTGGSATPTGITACFEYDHNAARICNSTCTESTSIYGAAFSPKNPGLAVTGGTDNRTKVWTVSNGTMTPEGHVFTGSGNGVLAFSPDGTLLAIGEHSGVQIVTVSNWAAVRTLTVTGSVYGVSFTPDSTQVVTLTNDSSATPPASHLYLHNVTSITAVQTVTLADGWAMGVSPAAPGGALPIAVTNTSGSVLVYSLTSAGFTAPATLTVTADPLTVQMAQFSPNGALLAAGADDGFVHFWPAPFTGAAQAPTIDVYTVTTMTSATVDAVAFSPDGSELAVGGGRKGSVTTYGTARRTQLGVEQDTSSGSDVTALAYSPDGKLIIGGEYDCGCVFLCQH